MNSHDAASIVHHLVSRVQAVEVENEPYQHFFLTSAFPPDVYAEMRRRLPDRQCYAPLNIKRWKNAAGESTRDRLLLSGGEIDRIRAEDQDFWSTVTTALTGKEFQLAVYDRFRDDIAIRLNCDREQVLQQQAWPTAMLVRDYEEYEIKPHPDGHPRVVTMMFYLKTSALQCTGSDRRYPGFWDRDLRKLSAFPFSRIAPRLLSSTTMRSAAACTDANISRVRISQEIRLSLRGFIKNTRNSEENIARKKSN
jgi:hypothetical protein